VIWWIFSTGSTSTRFGEGVPEGAGSSACGGLSGCGEPGARGEADGETGVGAGGAVGTGSCELVWITCATDKSPQKSNNTKYLVFIQSSFT
jgi:hypothetical protein